MKFVINDRSEITSYITMGDMPSSIEYRGTIPDDFEDNFKPSFYLLQNNKIVLNPNYVEPKPTIPASGPTTEQVMINQLGLQVATLTAEVNQLKGGVPNV